jgi:diguanylate cyclase (GGDEF)-like protein
MMMENASHGALMPPESRPQPSGAGQKLEPGLPGPDILSPTSWASTLGFCALFVLVVAGLTFAEWHWLVARQSKLRVLVRERTHELEQEKAELIRAKAALAELAARDSLTGLFNRGAVFEILEHEIKRSRREQCSFAVVLTDLDNFKRVNDTYGHLIGDEVLREFARRVHRNLRPYDCVGRFGGEELLILMPGIKDESGARIRDLHRQVTQEPFILGELLLCVTCSFGVAWYPAALSTAESLVSLADQALYAAKANGRNRVEVGEMLSPAQLGGSDRRRPPTGEAPVAGQRVSASISSLGVFPPRTASSGSSC